MTAAWWSVVAAALTTATITWWVPVSTDEAWFLQVVRRVARGERLYRGVFFGAAPLVVWVASALVRATRPQALVVRALGIFYQCGWLAAIAALMTAAHAPTLATITTVAAAMVLGGHHVAMHNQYGDLTNLGLVAGGAAALAGLPLMVGAGLALAILGRYPVGVVGAFLMVSVAAGTRGVPFAAGATAALAAVLAVCVAVGWGSWGDFYRCAVVNKRTYVSVSAMTPLEGLRRVVPAMTSPAAGALALPALIGFALLPVGAVVAVVATVVGISNARLELLIAASLLVGGLFMIYPRADRAHVVAAMPLIVAGCGLAAVNAAPPIIWWTAAGITAVAGVAGLSGRVLLTIRGAVRRDLPRLRGLPITSPRGCWPDATDDVRAMAGSNVLVLRPDAALFYLAGSLENPTPYDYPFASTFGPSGQGAVIESIRLGQVPWVCWSMSDGDRLAPGRLIAFVEGEMHEAIDTPVGSLRCLPEIRGDTEQI